ncbi:helix-turn-helix domain-containing protein [Sphingomonas sp. Root710]|uniref:helix-turn-helix domain-containing protein n=1 Tax=Sphingomonas sp. Root710 TaxID=1736594 RepID=UPI0009EA2978|nr:helix-turn-helix transcriptional regulator [Sphingomonas sp. Root710]
MYERALKTLRLYHRLTQSDLAEQLGMSRSYLNEIERKRKEPSLEILTKYAERFDIPLSSLMLFAEQTQNPKLDRARLYVADKVLKMLEWIAEDDQDAESEPEKQPAHTH